MRYGILSDVHGNLEALQVALDHLEHQSIDRIAFLGDAVGYGANPDEVCDLLRQRCQIAVVGNHDAAATFRMETEGYYQAAQDALAWCRAQLSSANTAWLTQLPYKIVEGDVTFSHAAPATPESFDYLCSPEQVEAMGPVALAALSPVNFIGHSHLTVSFEIFNGRANPINSQVIQCAADKHYIMTAGSVGQPRDRDPRLCCAVYDTSEREFSYHRLDYDREKTRQKIIAAGLAPMFGERLFLGV